MYIYIYIYTYTYTYSGLEWSRSTNCSKTASSPRALYQQSYTPSPPTNSILIMLDNVIMPTNSIMLCAILLLCYNTPSPPIKSFPTKSP